MSSAAVRTSPSPADAVVTHSAVSRLTWIVVLVLSVAGVALILFSTPYGGLDITPDTVEYYAEARSLYAGEGTLRFNGLYNANYPPGYSVVVLAASAVGSVFRLTPLESMRYFHALTYGLIVFCSGVLCLRAIRSRTLALIGTAAVAGSLALVQLTVSAWTESFFILLALIILLLMERFLRRPSTGLLIVMIVLTGASCIQRYMGITIVATGGLAILLFARESLPKRLRDSILYGLLSFAPLGARFLYNMTRTGEPAGSRPPAEMSALTATTHASNTLTAWFFPFDAQSTLFPIGILLLMAICGALIVVALRRGDFERWPLISATFVVVYCVGLLGAHSVIRITDIVNRELAPIYPFMIVVLFALLDRAAAWLTRRTGQPRADTALAALALVWLIAYPFQQTAREVAAFRTWCCNYTDWQALDVVQWVSENPLHGVVLSNSTLPLYVAPITDSYIVSVSGSLDHFNELAKPGDTLVWVDDKNRKVCAPSGKYCHQTEFELSDILPRLEPIAALSDGGVYRIKALSASSNSAS